MAITGNEIRKSFIQYFESKDHKHIRSSSLVPHNDPTILFTNAGMNQFKDYFLGNQKPEYSRAVTSQKVMRAGGKHNDLENVGRTDRHHTFFEMLGNFSFGDYFKKEAIAYAWEYLTVILKIPADKLVVSVFEDDQDAFDIWHQDIGMAKEKIGRLGEKENFWSMGDTGPCGPCSEIHYELNSNPDGKSVQQCLEDDDGTFLEIWNLVFMEYNREEDGTLNPLPKPSIDTGLGIERIASVVQHEKTNYGSDLLSGMVEKVLKDAPDPQGLDTESEISARVIADHIRAVVFLITDGVNPSNEGRGYVLKRIIRRAARHGKELGYHPGFFAELVDVFVPMMSEAYPEIAEAAQYIKIIIDQEEKRFSSTLNQGLKILSDLIEKIKAANQTEASGEEIFKLYDTYGFPADLADDILQDHGLSYNYATFNTSMEEQRKRAKSAQEGNKVDLKVSKVYLGLLEKKKGNKFVGYECQNLQTTLSAIIVDGKVVQEISQGDAVEVIVKETPFYAEQGGQVGDKGEIVHEQFRIVVSDTQIPVPGLIVSKGSVISTTQTKVKLQPDCLIHAKIAEQDRKQIERNHTATHLLQSALRTVIGDHVKQAGSLVNSEKLRFDFSHYTSMSKAQLLDVENIVNRLILRNEEVTSEVMSFDDATQTGAMAIFGEKYGDEVRVITAGSASKELCGGCHTSRTGNIGLVKIISEESIASGIRRIEAVSGKSALEFVQKNIERLENIAQNLKVPMSEVKERIEQMSLQSKEKDKQIEQLKLECQMVAAEKALANIKLIGGVNTLFQTVDKDVDLKSQSAVLQKNIQSGVILLGKTVSSDKISVILSISKDLTGVLKAGQLIKELSPLIAGRGGGSPNVAQCGGTNPGGWDQLKQALESKIQDLEK